MGRTTFELAYNAQKAHQPVVEHYARCFFTIAAQTAAGLLTLSVGVSVSFASIDAEEQSSLFSRRRIRERRRMILPLLKLLRVTDAVPKSPGDAD